MSGEKGGAFFVETSFSLGFDKSYKIIILCCTREGQIAFSEKSSCKNVLQKCLAKMSAKMFAKMFAESVRFVLAECNISVNTSIQVIRMEIL